MTLDVLKAALEQSWCAESAYFSDRKNWTKENSAMGQCTVTALIVYDFFGGKIVRGYSQEYKLFHYWNLIDGNKIDLTYSQFINKPDINFTNICYKQKEELLKIKSVRYRYFLLKRNVLRILNLN